MTQQKYTQLESRTFVLKSRISALEILHSTDEVILLLLEETRAELAQIDQLLSTRREYLYTFEGGGWNSEYAYTVEEARILASRRCDGMALQPQWDSFQVVTPETKAHYLAQF